MCRLEHAACLLPNSSHLQYAAPSTSFGFNPAYKWLYLFGGTAASFLPLTAAEGALFRGLASLAAAQQQGASQPQAQAGHWAAEALDFSTAAQGRLAPIAVVVLALLLKTVRMGAPVRSTRVTVCLARLSLPPLCRSSLSSRSLLMATLPSLQRARRCSWASAAR